MRRCRIVGAWVSLVLACGPGLDVELLGSSEAGTSDADASSESSSSETTSERHDLPPQHCEPAVFADAALARVVRAALGLGRTDRLDLELLMPLSRLESINDGIESLDGLECAYALDSVLVLNDGTDGTASAVTDLAPLAQLDALHFVDVSANAITELTALPQVSTLVLVGNPVAELDGLIGSDALSMLWIDATAVTELAPLAQLPALEYLKATGTPITTLDALAGCERLAHLDVADTAVADIDVVGELPALDFLRIDRTAVADLSPLAGHPMVVLQAAQIAITQLPSKLVVETIDLSGNGLVELGPMASWATPVQVDLRDNLVDDVAPLLELAWPVDDDGDCPYIELAGNPLGSPDALGTLQQICDTKLLEIDAGRGFHCRNPQCPVSPP